MADPTTTDVVVPPTGAGSTSTRRRWLPTLAAVLLAVVCALVLVWRSSGQRDPDLPTLVDVPTGVAGSRIPLAVTLLDPPWETSSGDPTTFDPRTVQGWLGAWFNGHRDGQPPWELYEAQAAKLGRERQRESEIDMPTDGAPGDAPADLRGLRFRWLTRVDTEIAGRHYTVLSGALLHGDQVMAEQVVMPLIRHQGRWLRTDDLDHTVLTSLTGNYGAATAAQALRADPLGVFVRESQANRMPDAPAEPPPALTRLPEDSAGLCQAWLAALQGGDTVHAGLLRNRLIDPVHLPAVLATLRDRSTSPTARTAGLRMLIASGLADNLRGACTIFGEMAMQLPADERGDLERCFLEVPGTPHLEAVLVEKLAEGRMTAASVAMLTVLCRRGGAASIEAAMRLHGRGVLTADQEEILRDELLIAGETQDEVRTRISALWPDAAIGTAACAGRALHEDASATPAILDALAGGGYPHEPAVRSAIRDATSNAFAQAWGDEAGQRRLLALGGQQAAPIPRRNAALAMLAHLHAAGHRVEALRALFAGLPGRFGHPDLEAWAVTLRDGPPQPGGTTPVKPQPGVH